MTYQRDTSALRNRLARAENERDSWRLTGATDKYLAAYFMVEALESQLNDRLLPFGPRITTGKEPTGLPLSLQIPSTVSPTSSRSPRTPLSTQPRVRRERRSTMSSRLPRKCGTTLSGC